jgi:hypothetical protein
MYELYDLSRQASDWGVRWRGSLKTEAVDPLAVTCADGAHTMTTSMS